MDLTVTRLARDLPVGGDSSTPDEVTLGGALSGLAGWNKRKRDRCENKKKIPSGPCNAAHGRARRSGDGRWEGSRLARLPPVLELHERSVRAYLAALQRGDSGQRRTMGYGDVPGRCAPMLTTAVPRRQWARTAPIDRSRLPPHKPAKQGQSRRSNVTSSNFPDAATAVCATRCLSYAERDLAPATPAPS